MEQLCWEKLYWRASGDPGVQEAECTDWYSAGSINKKGHSQQIEEHDFYLHCSVSRVLHPVLGPLMQGTGKQK